MRVVLDPGAREEVRAARAWYRERNPHAAQRFTAEVKAAVKVIAAAPLQAPEVRPGVRRMLLDRFPYALVYAVEPAGIVVLAVAHLKRRPDYWRSRRP